MWSSSIMQQSLPLSLFHHHFLCVCACVCRTATRKIRTVAASRAWWRLITRVSSQCASTGPPTSLRSSTTWPGTKCFRLLWPINQTSPPCSTYLVIRFCSSVLFVYHWHLLSQFLPKYWAISNVDFGGSPEESDDFRGTRIPLDASDLRFRFGSSQTK